MQAGKLNNQPPVSTLNLIPKRCARSRLNYRTQNCSHAKSNIFRFQSYIMNRYISSEFTWVWKHTRTKRISCSKTIELKCCCRKTEKKLWRNATKQQPKKRNEQQIFLFFLNFFFLLSIIKSVDRCCTSTWLRYHTDEFWIYSKYSFLRYSKINSPSRFDLT